MTIIACEARNYGLNFNFVCRIKIGGGGGALRPQLVSSFVWDDRFKMFVPVLSDGIILNKP